MFEEKNNSQQAPVNLPTQDSKLEEEKKLFGETEQQTPSLNKPPVMISKEFVRKKRKFPIILILVIIILIGLIITGLQAFLSGNQSFNQKAIETEEEMENRAEKLPEEAPLVAGPQIIDTDGDGLTDEEELTLGTSINNTDTDEDELFDFEEVKIYQTDPLNPDTDGDGYKDGMEVKSGYNPKDATPGAKLLDILEEIE